MRHPVPVRRPGRRQQWFAISARIQGHQDCGLWSALSPVKGVLQTAGSSAPVVGTVLATPAGPTSGGSGTGTLGSLLPPIDVLPPSISGATTVGSTLSASDGTWLSSPTDYSYQWQDCNSSGSGCTNIPAATSDTYRIAPSDAGDTVDVVVTATNSAGGGSATSSPTGVVTWEAPVNTGRPSVSGTAQQGDVLTASQGSWSNAPTSFAYQWQDCGASGGGCSNISGATGGTYTLGSGDVGHTVDVVVTASNSGGSGSAASAATAVVAAPPPPPSPPSNTALPTISGTAQVGSALSSSSGSWSGSPTGYGYQWQDCDSSGANCTNVSGATSSSYTLVSGDAGHMVDVVVTASNSSGSASATASAVGPVSSGGGGSTGNYFVGQAAQGTGSGSGSCSNAAAISTLSTATHWTAGNVIGLCGTITSQITAHGSGTSGDPITVYWEPGASVSLPAASCSAQCISISGQNYITLDGGTNGVLTVPNNGDQGSTNVGVRGVAVSNASNVTIKNLTIENLYLAHSDVAKSYTGEDPAGIWVINSPNFVLDHNTLSYAGDEGVIFVNSQATGTATISNNDFSGRTGISVLPTPPMARRGRCTSSVIVSAT